MGSHFRYSWGAFVIVGHVGNFRQISTRKRAGNCAGFCDRFCAQNTASKMLGPVVMYVHISKTSSKSLITLSPQHVAQNSPFPANPAASGNRFFATRANRVAVFRAFSGSTLSGKRYGFIHRQASRPLKVFQCRLATVYSRRFGAGIGGGVAGVRGIKADRFTVFKCGIVKVVLS